MGKRILSLTLSAIVIACASGQIKSQEVFTGTSGSRPRTVGQKTQDAVVDARALNPSEATTPAEEAAIQSQIDAIYRSFYASYRLGAGDVIGIYIDKHREDSVERVAVSAVGRVYFPLLGDVPVAGKTLPQLQEYFTTAAAEFIREPRVTLALLEAQSAKIGVLGDVRTPGVMVMTRPLRVLDAITQAGGILDTGSSTVSILRQYEDGRVQILKTDVRKILKGKASPEENAYLRAGDTVIVHGNLVKTLMKVSSLVGIASFATFIARGGR
jgi:polysaccharide biosynthesis/export protein